MIVYNYKENAKRKWAKTARKGEDYSPNYGQYVLNNIPESLKNTLIEYIQKDKLVAGNFLFGLDNNHNAGYSDSAWSTIVSKHLFETYSGIPNNINGLRSSYVSWHLNKLKTYKQKEQMAFEMGTSVSEMEKTYYKVILDPDNNDPEYVYIKKLK